MGKVIRPVPLGQNVLISVAGDSQVDWAGLGRLQKTAGTTQGWLEGRICT